MFDPQSGMKCLGYSIKQIIYLLCYNNQKTDKFPSDKKPVQLKQSSLPNSLKSVFEQCEHVFLKYFY